MFLDIRWYHLLMPAAWAIAAVIGAEHGLMWIWHHVHLFIS